MSDILVNCNHCGQVFSAPDDMVGQSIACSKCGKQVAIFTSAVRPEEGPKLQIKHDSVISGGKTCPSCGAIMAPEVVICIQCGYDTRTGSQYLDSPRKSNMLQWVLWGFGLLILAGLAKTFVFSGGTRDDRAAVAPPVQQASATVSSAATAETAGGTAAAQSATGVQSSVPPVAVEATNKIAKLEAEYRVRLNDQLATTYPMYAPGDAVVLRRVNGMVHRGTLAALKPDAVVVVAGGQTNEIPMKMLDRASRLKCDPAFRVEAVDFHVQKRVKELEGF
jgi:DNA-directed RNA polymerase subunit M/transcription elongation factor TFIIS